MVLRRHLCDGCDFCETAAESRAEAADEPYDDQGGRADQYERGIGYV